jgi:hypothetical protein
VRVVEGRPIRALAPVRSCHFGMRCPPVAQASFMLADRPGAFAQITQHPWNGASPRIGPARPVYGDALVTFPNCECVGVSSGAFVRLVSMLFVRDSISE